MKPPIASPHEVKKPPAPITKRIEWDAERECFVLRYVSPFWGRLRCEAYIGVRSLIGVLTAPISFPIVVFSLVIATLAQRFKAPSKLSVFVWGIEYTATEASYKNKWSNINRTFVVKANLFVMLKQPWGSAYCFPRENFADENEALRLQRIIELLQSQNGANWEAVKHQFQSEPGGLLQHEPNN